MVAVKNLMSPVVSSDQQLGFLGGILALNPASDVPNEPREFIWWTQKKFKIDAKIVENTKENMQVF